ncbi:MAG TPA: TetR/AcrR family transcriptional regulator [Mycobacteriales bacterium]|nr:TetR/AcrR family transcriptional regulator [Mycobacteriales bacterium]
MTSSSRGGVVAAADGPGGCTAPADPATAGSEPVGSEPAAEQPARVDGRSLRAERTRQAVVEALHALLAEGHLKVSGRQIAERAGVSLRALWSNFGDLEGLYAASYAHLLELQRAAYQPVPADLPLCERVAAFCRQRVRMLELIAPYARAAHLAQPYSPQLQRNRSVQIGHVRDEISALFRSELDAAGPGRERLRNAVLVATTFNAWQMARDQLGLDADEAAGVMIQTVTSLLATALAAGAS